MSTSHVPPCDPANLWGFMIGEMKVIGASENSGDSWLAFRVDKIEATSIEGTEFLDGQVVAGVLDLDRPVVIVKAAEDGEPMVTLTLRRIVAPFAFIQVSAHPSIRVYGASS